MEIVGRKLTRSEFRDYVRDFDFGSIPPSKIVIHHTAVPTKAQWKGDATLHGIKRYYERKGWTAGPHLFIADEGIYLFTPMSEVGIHAGGGNASYKWGRLEWYSVGIEVVGNYDTKKWDGETKLNVLSAIQSLKDYLEIQNTDITFHRDWMPKSCPGSSITKEWLFQELERFENPPVIEDQVSPWAKDAWEWQKMIDLDRSVHPQQQVTAEWTFAILKKYHDKFGR